VHRLSQRPGSEKFPFDVGEWIVAAGVAITGSMNGGVCRSKASRQAWFQGRAEDMTGRPGMNVRATTLPCSGGEPVLVSLGRTWVAATTAAALLG
jgi:hypothetical protein